MISLLFRRIIRQMLARILSSPRIVCRKSAKISWQMTLHQNLALAGGGFVRNLLTATPIPLAGRDQKKEKRPLLLAGRC